MKSYLFILTAFLPFGASASTVFTSVRTYAANSNLRVYDLDAARFGTSFSRSEVTRNQFFYPDAREAYGFAEANSNILRSSVTVEGSATGVHPNPPAGGGGPFTGDIQVGATAGTSSNSIWKPTSPTAGANATIPVSFNFSYHGELHIPTVGPGFDPGWNRGSAEFIFNVYDRPGFETLPIASFYAPLGLSSSGVGLMFDHTGFKIYDNMGNPVSTVHPTVHTLGGNRYEFDVSGVLPFNAVNNRNLRIEFEVGVLAAASNTNLVHTAKFENTASYSLTSSDPDATFTLIPEPGSTTLLGLAFLFAAARRKRS